MDGLELLRRLTADDEELKIVMLTGNGTISSAVEAMKRGATDYLIKPFGLSELDMVVRRVTQTKRLERENQHLRRRLALQQPDKSNLIGQSPGMVEVKRLIERVAGGLQAKLLRVLEDGSMRRIGSIRERKVKVRLIAATNRDLAVEVANGRFREDLYYRVNVLSIHLPPLRARLEDLPLLVNHFLEKTWTLGPGVMALFSTSKWPGNVRQLINALERAKILADDPMIHLENLPADLRRPRNGTGSKPGFENESAPTPPSPIIGSEIELCSLSKLHVMEVLKRNNGNKARSARALGIARRSLYRLLERFEADS